MSDPIPLKDDPEVPVTLRRWLSEAPHAVPLDDARRARLRNRVIAGSAGVAIAAIAWKALAAILVTATIGAVAWTATRDEEPTPSPSAPSRAIPAAPVTESAPEVTPIDDPSEVLAPAPVEPEARREPREPTERSLTDETELLRRAGALVVSSPRAALSALKRHERRYPDGALVGERELLTIEALRNLGRRDAALRRARATATRFSGSLVGRRAGELVDELSRGTSR